MEKKVLLVADDDEMNRRIIRRFLKNDYQVIEAENGRIAMDTLHATHVDGLLLDIIMPEMDGLEVLATLRGEQELDHVAVLVATSAKERTEREALSLGADDIVSKPYDPVVIKKRMANILAMKSAQMMQKHLLEQEPESVWIQKRKDTSFALQGSIHNIEKYADLIGSNQNNPKLIEELIQDIHKEAGQMLSVITKEE